MEIKIIKNKLTFNEAISFINSAVSSNFIVDEESGEKMYSPYIGTIALKTLFLKYYTNYEDCDDLDTSYEMVADIDISNYLTSIAQNQFNEIKKAIEEEVENEKNLLAKQQGDEFSKLLKIVTEKISGIDLTAFEPKVIMDFIQKFKDSDLTPESIVNCYLSTDEYQKKQAEIFDSKTETIKAMKGKMKKEIINEITKEFGTVLRDKSF